MIALKILNLSSITQPMCPIDLITTVVQPKLRCQTLSNNPNKVEKARGIIDCIFMVLLRFLFISFLKQLSFFKF
jgi:hypothetical protein